MDKLSLLWFNNDLRLHDHAALQYIAANSKQLICLFCYDENWDKPNGLNAHAMGENRKTFLFESLQCLAAQLQQLGQSLLVIKGKPVAVISDLIQLYGIDAVYRSEHAGVYEQRQWQHLKVDFPRIKFTSFATSTLFEQTQLSFALSGLPSTFSRFHKLMAGKTVISPGAAANTLPPTVDDLPGANLDIYQPREKLQFEGGESAGLHQVKQYFTTLSALSYKSTRNELDGWLNSTKISPWLANGSLSVRRVLQELHQFEQQHGANESTSWIAYELMWREYFQWYAHRYQHLLFRTKGISQQKKRCCFYPERYQRWCHGNTPYALVNACMKQLNATGYISNRGRQIVASCLINELGLDWRYGAAYFEQQLLDYDVAVNWGNWQYIAGVGADPRGGRHFNLDQQTALYDPEQVFINKWQGQPKQRTVDSVDAGDWPIMPDK